MNAIKSRLLSTTVRQVCLGTGIVAGGALVTAGCTAPWADAGTATTTAAAASPAATGDLQMATASPCAPCAPCAPLAAADPCAPCAPCAAADPCAPCAVADPCAPCVPAAADPCAPCAVADPCAPCDPCAPAAATVSAACEVPRLAEAAANPCAAEPPCGPCAPAHACDPCSPCAPEVPCQPCAAANPCAAASPCAPCGPCAPRAVADPCAPCAPCAAADPCAPCAPCAPAADVELTAAEAQAAYDCLLDEMLQGYAQSGLDVAAAYPDWPRFSERPYVSATHGGRYVQNYADAVAAEPYGRFEEIGEMPAGGTIAKPSFVAHPDGRLAPGPLFLMEKMEAGFNPDSGDWRYTLINPDGAVVGVTNGPGSENVEFCAGCHMPAAADHDSLLFLPEELRVTAR